MLKDYKVPIVILGQHLDGYPCIYQDDHKAAFQVTEKLAEKGKSLPISALQIRTRQLVPAGKGFYGCYP